MPGRPAAVRPAVLLPCWLAAGLSVPGANSWSQGGPCWIACTMASTAAACGMRPVLIIRS